jgi:WD40 repeat protein
MGFRKMLDQLTSERTLKGAILPPKSSHTNSIISIEFNSSQDLALFSGICSSIVLDFFIKVIASKNLTPSRLSGFPYGIPDKYKGAIIVRTLRLNCVNSWYKALWEECYNSSFSEDCWSSNSKILSPYCNLKNTYDSNVLLRNEYERRLALIELDVITAMAYGLTLDELLFINKNYFNISSKFDDNTWYDIKGNIVFSNRVYELDLERKDWDLIKDQLEGETYIHTIDPSKSELYGGQQVTYYAPYTKCDRIEDYRRAWAHFEKIFKEEE